MLVGHPMDSTGFATLAPLLADDYTVVAYDPRGFGQSTIDDPGQDADPDVLADDVRRILDAVDGEPAHVFGSSGGAVTGLALVARHPERVRTLVAHEPPLALLLPDADATRAAFQDVYDTYRRDGIGPAFQRFLAFTGLTEPSPAEDSAAQPPEPDRIAAGQRFFAHGLLPITLYEPDVAALRAAAPRLVVGVGTASTGTFPARTAAALAERLGTSPAGFPGGHTGFLSDTEEFAAVLRRNLA